MRNALLAALFLFVSGCTMGDRVPPEAAVASTYLLKAAEANAESRARQFDVMAANMRVQHEKTLDLTTQLICRARATGTGADSQPTVPIGIIEECQAAAAAQRKKFEGDLLIERKKWVEDPNIKAELELARTNEMYVQSVDAFAREMERITSKLGLSLQPKTGE